MMNSFVRFQLTTQHTFHNQTVFKSLHLTNAKHDVSFFVYETAFKLRGISASLGAEFLLVVVALIGLVVPPFRCLPTLRTNKRRVCLWLDVIKSAFLMREEP